MEPTMESVTESSLLAGEKNYLVIEQPVVDYAMEVLGQMGDDESDVESLCEVVTLLEQVDSFKAEFLAKNGLKLLLQAYERHKEDIPFTVFGAPLCGLLPGGAGGVR